MKKYNRALDYTVLALSELRAGKPVLAARLLASAAKEADVGDAIAILEASNRHAYKTTAAATKKLTQTKTSAIASKKRLSASDEFPFEDDEVDADAEDMGSTDFESDPLEEVADFDDDGDDMDDDDDEMPEEDEAPAVAMAKVLSSMTRTVKK